MKKIEKTTFWKANARNEMLTPLKKKSICVRMEENIKPHVPNFSIKKIVAKNISYISVYFGKILGSRVLE